MSTLAHTESARPSHLRAHLSAYLLGGGATTALTAGALVVFLSLATFVAFNDVPFGGSSDDSGAAYLGANSAEDYVQAAVRLGSDRDWREEVKRRVREGSDAIFEDHLEGYNGALHLMNRQHLMLQISTVRCTFDFSCIFV